MWNNMVPVLINMVPVLIGGLLGIGGVIVSQWLNDRRARRAIAGAFAGEIGAICSIIRSRKYLESLKQLLENIEQTKQPARAVVHITHNYWTIYHANAKAIGLLSAPLALDAARFYTQLKSLTEDVRPDAHEPEDVTNAEAQLTKQITFLDETLQIGDTLVTGLQKVAQ